MNLDNLTRCKKCKCWHSKRRTHDCEDHKERKFLRKKR